jgi:hypothetical protein
LFENLQAITLDIGLRLRVKNFLVGEYQAVRIEADVKRR